MTTGKTFVTDEQSRPEARDRIKLPDVCDEFSVDFEDTFAMLRRLGFQHQFERNR